MELMKASHQWATRPEDQRFVSLLALNAFAQDVKERSRANRITSRGIQAIPVDGDHKSLMLERPKGDPMNVTHWAFGQLAQRAGAPAQYMREIPGPLAADCINYGLQHSRDSMDLGILSITSPHIGAPAEVAAVTGPNYGRVWNATITKSLVDRFGDGVTSAFRVPGEWGKKVQVTKDNTTIYASDRDMFVFLADEEHKIEMHNRRAGKNGTLSRGFFLWNSEVGSTSFGVATFLFDYVCGNRIVWGAQDYKEVRFRHTSSAPQRWIDDVVPALTSYANSETVSVTEAIAAAQKAKVDNVDDFLQKRFSKGIASNIKAAHLADEQRPMETLWDVTTGITAYARSVGYQDERVRLEREAGKVLDLAA
jgi:hypothetical protein